MHAPNYSRPVSRAQLFSLYANIAPCRARAKFDYAREMIAVIVIITHASLN